MRKHFIVSSVGILMLFQRLHNCFAHLFEEKIGILPLKGNQIRTVSNSKAATLQGFLCNSHSLDSYNSPFAAVKLIPLRNLSEIKDEYSCISIILSLGLYLLPHYSNSMHPISVFINQIAWLQVWISNCHQIKTIYILLLFFYVSWAGYICK